MHEDHTAARPIWDCRYCDKPWPCDSAREALAAELSPVRLAVYLWVNFEEAAEDLPGSPVTEMIDRFLRWAPPIHVPPAAL